MEKKLIAKKKLGQNFLVNKSMQQKVAEEMNRLISVSKKWGREILHNT